ncbi:Ceramide transfer protein, partial [Fragariocoptes setiger]
NVGSRIWPVLAGGRSDRQNAWTARVSPTKCSPDVLLPDSPDGSPSQNSFGEGVGNEVNSAAVAQIAELAPRRHQTSAVNHENIYRHCNERQTNANNAAHIKKNKDNSRARTTTRTTTKAVSGEDQQASTQTTDHSFGDHLVHQVYELADYNFGGKLIDTVSGKRTAAEALFCLRKQLATLVIPYIEQTSSVQHESATSTINTERIANDKRRRFGRHRAVGWSTKPTKRGRYGESLIHILIINNTRQHMIVLRELVLFCPPLVDDVMLGEQFLGVTCLHLAIAYRNNELLELLLRTSRARVNHQATGTFFGQNQQLSTAASRQSAFNQLSSLSLSLSLSAPTATITDEGDQSTMLGRANDRRLANEFLTYFGQSPLAWATCWQNEHGYDQLLAHGAQPNLGDTLYGNTCLHVVVVRRLPAEWYAFVARRGANQRARNAHGHTPLLLACQLGNWHLFRAILELSAHEFWSYSSITCRGYPLDVIDSLSSVDGCSPTAMSVILQSTRATDREKAQLLSVHVMQHLLEQKWRVFGRRHFTHGIVELTLHLLMLTIAVQLRPSQTSENSIDKNIINSRHKLSQLVTSANVRLSIELLIVLSSAMHIRKFLNQLQRTMAARASTASHLQSMCSSNTSSMFTLSCLLVLIIVPLRLINSQAWLSRRFNWNWNAAEDILLALAMPLAWSHLLSFAAAFRLTGPFVSMIGHMLTQDLRQFSIIYVVFVYAFSQAFYFTSYNINQAAINHNVTQASSDTSVERALTYLSSWMDLFKMTLGVHEFENYRQSNVTQALFVLFMVIVPILLLNMLIAMMNNTYSQIIAQSEREWSFQWAKTLFAIECSLTPAQRHHYLGQYAINMVSPNNEQPNDEQSSATIDRDNNTHTVVSLADVCDDSTATNIKHDDNDNQQQQHQQVNKAASVPALMIITRLSTTKAKRRKLAIDRWRLVLTKTCHIVTTAFIISPWHEIDRTTSNQLYYAQLALNVSGWQLFAEDGQMKLYTKELEIDGLVCDPLKAIHVVKGVTGYEMCHRFFNPNVRNEWELTLESMHLLEEINNDTLIFHQIHKRVWPAAQRDAVFWSHIRRIPEPRASCLSPDDVCPDNDPSLKLHDVWMVCNNSTDKPEIPPGSCVRLKLTVSLVCETYINANCDLSKITRDDLTCKIIYSSTINPGGWAPATVLRALYKREYPRFLNSFTAYVKSSTENQPISFGCKLFLLHPIASSKSSRRSLITNEDSSIKINTREDNKATRVLKSSFGFFSTNNNEEKEEEEDEENNDDREDYTYESNKNPRSRYIQDSLKKTKASKALRGNYDNFNIQGEDDIESGDGDHEDADEPTIEEIKDLSEFEQLIQEKDYVLVFFYAKKINDTTIDEVDESMSDSERILESLETIDDECDSHGIAFVKIDNDQLAAELGLADQLPCLIFYNHQLPSIYEGEYEPVSRVLDWVVSQQSEQSIEHVTDEILNKLIQQNPYVLALFTPKSCKSECNQIVETLETIDDDIDEFGIVFVTVDDIDLARRRARVTRFPALVLFSSGAEPKLYGGDLHQAEHVLRWVTDEETLDSPNVIDTINGAMFNKLISTSSSVAVLFVKDRCRNCDQVVRQLESIEMLIENENIDICKINDVKLAREHNISEKNLPALVYFNNKIPTLYKGNLMARDADQQLLEWLMEIKQTRQSAIELVSSEVLSTLLNSSDFANLVVLYYDPEICTSNRTTTNAAIQKKSSPQQKCKKIINELENIDERLDQFGLQFVKCDDVNYARSLGVMNLPSLVYYERDAVPSVYYGDLEQEDQVFDWLIKQKQEETIENINRKILDKLINANSDSYREYVAVVFYIPQHEESDDVLEIMELVDGLVFFRHGIPLKYDSDLYDKDEIVEWLTRPSNLEISDIIETVNRDKMFDQFRHKSQHLAVLFSTDSGACKQCHRVLEAMEKVDDKASAAGIRFIKVDNMDIARQFGVHALPALVFITRTSSTSFDTVRRDNGHGNNIGNNEESELLQADNQQAIIYAGDLKRSDKILEWLLQQKSPNQHQITEMSGAECQQLISQSDHVAVFFYNSHYNAAQLESDPQQQQQSAADDVKTGQRIDNNQSVRGINNNNQQASSDINNNPTDLCDDYCLAVLAGLNDIEHELSRFSIEFVKTHDLALIEHYGIRELPALMYFEKGTRASLYQGDLFAEEDCLDWLIQQALEDRIEEVTSLMLDRMIETNHYLAVLFSKPHCRACTLALEKLELVDSSLDLFDVQMVKIQDIALARRYGIRTFPALVYFRNGNPLIYDGDIKDEKSILEWLISDEARKIDDEIEEVSGKMLAKLIERSPFLAALFYDDDCVQCPEVIDGLERIDSEADIFGIEFVKINDFHAARKWNVHSFPTLVYFRRQSPSYYDGDLLDEASVLAWLTSNIKLDNEIEEVTNSRMLEKLLEANHISVLFYCSECDEVMSVLESIDRDADLLGIQFVKCRDPNYAKKYGINQLPAFTDNGHL